MKVDNGRAARNLCREKFNFIGLQVDLREDEESKEKFGQIIDLLLAAGYFRARISTLPPFDKVPRLV